MGAMAGALCTYIVPQWLAISLLAILFAVYLLYKRRSDKFFDERIAELETRGLHWETSEES
jgi:uncharacterized membrane protein YfcA